MAYQRLIAAAMPVAMFLLWLILGRDVTTEVLVTGIAVALAVAMWAPLIDF
jgi:hypothetical protein